MVRRCPTLPHAPQVLEAALRPHFLLNLFAFGVHRAKVQFAFCSPGMHSSHF